MKAPETTPIVKLVGENGNAFAIMGRVSTALKRAGADKEFVDEYLRKSMSGDYNHLLGAAMEYVDAQ